MSRVYDALRRAERATDDEGTGAVVLHPRQSNSPPVFEFPRETDDLAAQRGSAPEIKVLAAPSLATPPQPSVIESTSKVLITASPVDVDVATAPDAARTADSTVCPHCAAPCHTQSLSAWARGWSRISRVPPYRCSACKRRFKAPRYRVQLTERVATRSIPGFLAAVDHRSFSDLIRDMKRDERARQLQSDDRSTGNQ
jgi:hypothetical protein